MVRTSTETGNRTEKEDCSLWPFAKHDNRERHKGLESILSQMQREFLRGEKFSFDYAGGTTGKSEIARAYFWWKYVCGLPTARLYDDLYGEQPDFIIMDDMASPWGDSFDFESQVQYWVLDTPKESSLTYIQDEPTCRSCIQRLGGYRSEVYNTAYRSSHGNIPLQANKYSTGSIEQWLTRYNRLSVRLRYSGGCIIRNTGRAVLAYWKPAWYVEWLRQARKHIAVVGETKPPRGPMVRPGQYGECWYKEIDERHDAIWARIHAAIQQQRPEVIKRQVNRVYLNGQPS